MSVDWWCEITMKNHKVKLIIFYIKSFRQRETKRIIASRSLVISPRSSPEKNKNKSNNNNNHSKRKIKFFRFYYYYLTIVFFCVLFCFSLFFLGAASNTWWDTRQCYCYQFPPGMKKKRRRRTASEKNKNNTCPRMEHEAMKPVELTALYVMMVALVRK